MKTFKIEGGHQLKGSIQPQGAKNEALQIICAVLLTSEEVTIKNVPDILDVNLLLLVPGERQIKLAQSAILNPSVDFVLINEVGSAVWIAKEQPIPTIRPGNLALFQEGTEGSNPRSRRHHDNILGRIRG